MKIYCFLLPKLCYLQLNSYASFMYILLTAFYLIFNDHNVDVLMFNVDALVFDSIYEDNYCSGKIAENRPLSIIHDSS